VTLQNATATASQSAFAIDKASDRIADASLNGWAIEVGATSAQTAVWGTALDLNASGISRSCSRST
jgi:hypothetical protein